MRRFSWLNHQQREQISQAVNAAETKTSGEIVPMVVGQSDHYPGAIWRLGVFFSLLFVFVYYMVIPEFTTWFYLAMIVPMLFIGKFLAHLPMLMRLALSDDEVEEEVFQRALQEFHAQKVNHTSKHTGVLIFVSLLERRVVLLADEGINAKVPQGTWHKIVEDLIAAIRQERVSEGFCQAIQATGAILAEHFPRTAADRNERPNRLVVKV